MSVTWFLPQEQGSEELRTKVHVCLLGNDIAQSWPVPFRGLKTCALVFQLVLSKEKPKTLFFSLMNYSSFALRPQLLFYFQLSFSITPFRNKNGKRYLAPRKKYVHTFKKQFRATLITWILFPFLYMMDEITLIMLAFQLLIHAKKASPWNLVTLFIPFPPCPSQSENQRALEPKEASVIPKGRIKLKSHTYWLTRVF